jgi:GNAT superfamily N-acetyltransferase
MGLAENAVRYAAPMVYVHRISVRPAFRAMGVGKALLNTARSAAEDLGITRLGLDVWTFSKSAQSFFRSQGFVPVREVLFRG